MTSICYFGKMNSILGSVVPLAMFDPEIPNIDSWRREEEKRCFTKHTDELQRVLAERQEDGEEGSDEEESGPSEFGNLSKKMKRVTEDGGVLKRVLREGFQTGG